MAKELLKGNVAIAEAALRAGLQAYFGYPITPQTELMEHLALRMPELGRPFLQAESEVAAINMVFGAACTGVRVMTSSSSPGMSLMQEGLSYMACAEVPAVIVDIMRGGPGLGNIQAAQGDYNQLTKSAGHGDFRCVVLAPSSVQEAIDLMTIAFDLAEKYRTLVIIAADGMIGQMMEPAELPPMQDPPSTYPDWALTGAKGRPKNTIITFHLGKGPLEKVNLHLQAKLQRIKDNEVRYETMLTDDAELLVVAFGTAGRIAKTAIREARRQGVRAGLLRPISLFPFPSNILERLSKQVRAILVVEMNTGQMLDDVKVVVRQQTPVKFFGRPGGAVPMPIAILNHLLEMDKKFALPESHVDERPEPIETAEPT